MKISLPWPPKQLNPNARLHWAVKSKAVKKYRSDCCLLTKAQKLTINWDGDIHLFVDYYPPDKRQRDQDNIIASAKACFDGLADALGVNDVRFRHHPCLREQVVKGGSVVVKICEAP